MKCRRWRERKAVLVKHMNLDAMDTAHTLGTEHRRGGRRLRVFLPSGLGDEGGKGEPVVILVLLEVGEGEEQEGIELGERNLIPRGNAPPEL
jgi:hypothetical protein